MTKTYSDLSYRGNETAKPNNRPPLWDILDDLWHPESNPNGFVNLGVAENSLMHEEMIQFTNETFNISPNHLTYGDGGIGSKRLRAALVHFINRNFNVSTPVTTYHVAVTAGVTAALEACAWSLADPGDGFLLGRPYYGSFPAALGTRAGVKTVGVDMGGLDPFSLEAVTKYEEMLLQSEQNGVPIKALLLCSPNNPLGRCYPREVLVALMRLCQKYQIHLVSDEIYALSQWENPEAPDAAEFTSVLSIDKTGVIDPGLVHVLWGMSKDFGSNGLRLGCIISQSNRAFLEGVRTNSLYTYPSSPSDHITANILENDLFTDSYIRTNSIKLAETYQFTTRFLKSHNIPYQPGGNAGFFIWIDLRAFLKPAKEGVSDGENELYGCMLKNRVFVANGLRFGSEEPGWFRFVFAHPRAYLQEGLKRMADSLEL